MKSTVTKRKFSKKNHLEAMHTPLVSTFPALIKSFATTTTTTTPTTISSTLIQIHSYCTPARTMTFLSQVPSTVPTSNTVTYSCTMNNNWSAENHPINYPFNAHWSPPIIAAHGKKYNIWQPDNLATEGVKNVAEVRAHGRCEIAINESILTHGHAAVFSFYWH